MQAAELSESLIEEAFAFVLGDLVVEAIARAADAKRKVRGPAVLSTASLSPEDFITYYVIERGLNVTVTQLKSRGAQEIFQRMTGDVDALAAALRIHIEG